jgi:outer membrane protein assembly factor BamB
MTKSTSLIWWPLFGIFILLNGCTTTPMARTVHFDVQWIRSTLNQDNYGYRHAERTAPLVDGQIIYDGNGLDGVVAFEKNNGHLLWRADVAHGVESGLAISGDNIFFGASDGQFYCLNKLTGKTVWTFPTRVENLARPLVQDGVVYFLSGNNVLYALDEKSGKQLWVYNRGDISSLSIRGGSRPTLYKGVLYVGFSDGFLGAVNARDGSLVWERKLNTNAKCHDRC